MAGIFTDLEQLCLQAHERIVGLDLADVTVGGCIVKVPCGGEVPANHRASVIDTFIALANAVIITGRRIRAAWTTHRWNTRPARRP